MTQQPPFGNVLVGVDGTPTGLDAIALGARLCSPGGRLTLGNIVLTTSPTYRNFFATPVWSTRREMLERERDAIRVVAELTGMFAPSVGDGYTSWAPTVARTCWSWGRLPGPRSGACWSATTLAEP